MILIRKSVTYENTARYYENSTIQIPKKIVLYVVSIDGKRVDGFMYLNNARRKARELKDQFNVRTKILYCR